MKIWASFYKVVADGEYFTGHLSSRPDIRSEIHLVATSERSHALFIDASFNYQVVISGVLK